MRSAGSGLDPRPLGGGRGLFASGALILFVRSSGGSVARRLLLHVPRHRGNPIDKLGLEENVGIVEHPILQRHHDKLGAEKESKRWDQNRMGLMPVLLLRLNYCNLLLVGCPKYFL